MNEEQEDYIPPHASVTIESHSSWDCSPTYSPSIVFTEDMLTPNLPEGEQIFERSNVNIIMEDGTKIPLGIETNNEKVLFSKEKQIYKKIVDILSAQNEEVYYLDDGNKVMLSYNGNILISYANVSRSYQEVIDMYSSLGSSKIQFEKI